jgi:hypothetical protein
VLLANPGTTAIAVQACSTLKNRAVVATGASPHWPPGATRYLITTAIVVIDLKTGATVFQHSYPTGNMGGQREVGPPGDWVLVTPSPDGRYLAETSVFNGTTSVRDIVTNQIVTTLRGTVAGFSADGSRLVINATNGMVGETRVVSLPSQTVIWRAPATASGVLYRSGTSDLLIALNNAHGSSDIVDVQGRTGKLIARDVEPEIPGIFYPGA